MTRLDRTQLAMLAEDGYVVLHEVLPPQELQRWRDAIDGLAERMVARTPPGVEIVWEESDGSGSPEILQLLNAELVSPALAELVSSDTLLDVVEPYLGPDIGLFHAKLLMKSGGGGSAVPWHQDFAYWRHEAVEPVQLNCMIYLDDADEENGCLRTRPASHRLGLLDHGFRSEAAFHATLSEPADGLVPLAAKAGSAVVFGPLLGHGSGQNLSSRSRRACTIAYTVPMNGACRKVLRRGVDDGLAEITPVQPVPTFSGAGPHGGQCAVHYRFLEVFRVALREVDQSLPWVQVGVGPTGAFEWLAARKPPGIRLYRFAPFREQSTAHPEVVCSTDLRSPVDGTRGIALLHIESALYATTAPVLETLGSMLRPGAVVAFTQFHGFDGCRRQTAHAFADFVRSAGMEIEYLAQSDQGVAVRVLRCGVHPSATASSFRPEPTAQGISSELTPLAPEPSAAPPRHAAASRRQVWARRIAIARDEMTPVARHFPLSKVPRIYLVDPRSRCEPHATRRALWEYALSFVENTALPWAEFGVGAGETLDWFSWHKPTENVLLGFDSFEGIPEPWLDQPAGQWRSSPYKSHRDDVSVVEGMFADSLWRNDVRQLFEPQLGFVHIDCDLYSSTRTVFESIADVVDSGTVIVFDEFSGFAGWPDLEARAFYEFCRDRRVQIELLARTGWQLAARVVAVDSEFRVDFPPFDAARAVPETRVTFDATILRKARRRIKTRVARMSHSVRHTS